MAILDVIDMTITKREILCERKGENITTPPSPVRAWQPDDLPLLQVKEQYCTSCQLPPVKTGGLQTATRDQTVD
jgi:hypothetical protein